MSFHASIRPILLIFLLFGQFPIGGILRPDPARWRFRWCSVPTLLCLALMHVGLLLCYIEYDRLRVIGVNADNLIGPLFYVDVLVIMLLLLTVARKWPSVVLPKWQQIESLPSMQRTGSSDKGSGSLQTIRMTAVGLIFFGFLEHMLSIAKTVYARIDEGRICGWDYDNLPEYYALRTYGFFFRRIPYNLPTFLILEYANTALTMVWTVQDVVIIMISGAIAEYFECINVRVQLYATVQSQVGRDSFWSDTLADYVAVCELLEQVMAITSPLLVVSCGTNLYLICYQLYHLFEVQQFAITAVFTYFSLFFVILRTFLTLHYCASVQEVARKPLKLFHRIPSALWCGELDRFSYFIRKTAIVIRAMGLFKITKKTMLTMLGAVITYELVMLNFARKTAKQGVVPKCSQLAFSFEPKIQSSAP